MSDINKSATFTFALASTFFKNINHFLNIKYHWVLKLKRIDSYRAWRDMTKLLLEALDLWDILMRKKQLSTRNDEDKKQNFIDRERNCVLFLFQMIDVILLLILTTNKKLNKIWVTLEQKFDMKTMKIFLTQFRDLFRLRLKDYNLLSDHLIFFEIKLI
jgi:hypothetical protein